MKGRVNLHDCLRACDRRKLCFGVEFWPNDLSNGETEHANCFECPTIPGKIQTIEIITGGAWSIPNKATVYEKTTTNLSHKGIIKFFQLLILMKKKKTVLLLNDYFFKLG